MEKTYEAPSNEAPHMILGYHQGRLMTYLLFRHVEMWCWNIVPLFGFPFSTSCCFLLMPGNILLHHDTWSVKFYFSVSLTVEVRQGAVRPGPDPEQLLFQGDRRRRDSNPNWQFYNSNSSKYLPSLGPRCSVGLFWFLFALRRLIMRIFEHVLLWFPPPWPCCSFQDVTWNSGLCRVVVGKFCEMIPFWKPRSLGLDFARCVCVCLLGSRRNQKTRTGSTSGTFQGNSSCALIHFNVEAVLRVNWTTVGPWAFSQVYSRFVSCDFVLVLFVPLEGWRTCPRPLLLDSFLGGLLFLFWWNPTRSWVGCVWTFSREVKLVFCRGMEKTYEAPSNEAPHMILGYHQGRLMTYLLFRHVEMWCWNIVPLFGFPFSTRCCFLLMPGNILLHHDTWSVKFYFSV